MFVHALVLAFTLAAPDAGAAAPAPAPAATAEGPAEFIDDVKVLYQIVTCQEGPPPEPLDAKTVEAYCARMKPKFDGFRTKWVEKASPFLVSLHSKDAPRELVYPFGGGDLMMALATFPEATPITTLSLELAGDPRRVRTLKEPKKLADALAAINGASTSTLVSNDSLSKNLSKVQRGDLPGQLSMHLMGLALNGFEPVSVRYFRIEDDGALHYYSLKEIAAQDDKTAASFSKDWKQPDFSPAFANVEVQFVPKGQPNAARRIHRHIGADLSDDGLKKAPGVLKYLEAKGHVSAMTKAASYLMWRGDFATIRNYLLEHADFMMSDSTGVPVRYWQKIGYTIEAYGTFDKAFLNTTEAFQRELREVYAKKSYALPMRFGYPDGSDKSRSHLIIVRKPGAQLPDVYPAVTTGGKTPATDGGTPAPPPKPAPKAEDGGVKK